MPKDLSRLQPTKTTDKNGRLTTVYKKSGQQSKSSRSLASSSSTYVNGRSEFEYSEECGVSLLNGELAQSDSNSKLVYATRRHLKEETSVLSDLLPRVAENTTIEEAAQNSGLPITTLRIAAESSSVEPSWSLSPRSRARLKRIDHVSELIREGNTLEHIASIYGVSRTQIQHDLLEVGIQPNSLKKDQKNDQAAKIREMAERNLEAHVIAEELGMDVMRVRRIAREENIEINRILKSQIHGELQRYRNGCRCNACKAANNKAMELGLESRINKEVPEEIHGTNSGYVNWFCRCDRCKAANAEKMLALAAESKAKSYRNHREWEYHEDAAVLNYALTAQEVALNIGRTFSAVNSRRQLLKKRYQ